MPLPFIGCRQRSEEVARTSPVRSLHPAEVAETVQDPSCHLPILPSALGCPLKHKMSLSELLLEYMLSLYVGDHQKKFRVLSQVLTVSSTHLFLGPS